MSCVQIPEAVSPTMRSARKPTSDLSHLELVNINHQEDELADDVKYDEMQFAVPGSALSLPLLVPCKPKVCGSPGFARHCLWIAGATVALICIIVLSILFPGGHRPQQATGGGSGVLCPARLQAT